jgi:DNA-binding MarR family transcriptional regulator
LAVWRGFLSTHSRINGALGEEMEASCGLTLSEYEVMLKVAMSTVPPGVSEIAARMLISTSGISRLIDRLELRGLLERRLAEGDGRGRTVSLTDAGKVHFEEAHRVHLAGVRRLFLSRVDVPEQKQLAEFWERFRLQE